MQKHNSVYHLQKDYFGLELLDGFIYVHVNLGRNPVGIKIYKERYVHNRKMDFNLVQIRIFN